MPEIIACERCEGQGRIEWSDSYKIHDGRWVDDGGLSECDDCSGTGEVMSKVSIEAVRCARDIIGSKDVQHVALVIQQYLTEARQQAAGIARNGCLVPPDGGSPTDAEIRLCDEISSRILASL